uniref:PH domain-containing protein n=1 Tax=Aureoumbra lagunensis TaxID=44058 RepID=A0A7S3JQK4_9STRA
MRKMVLGCGFNDNTLVQKNVFRESAFWERRSRLAPAKAGWIEKKAKSLGYRKRFFIASGTYIRQFADDSCGEMLATIDIRGAQVIATGERRIVLSRGKNKFIMRFTNELERDDWLNTLKSMVARSVELPESDETSTNSLGGIEEKKVSIHTSYNTNASHPSINNNPGASTPRKRKMHEEKENQCTPKTRVRFDEELTTANESYCWRDSVLSNPRPSNPAAAAGALLKRTNGKWRLRYFVAYGKHLRYFQNDEAGAPLLGAINLTHVSVQAHTQFSDQFLIILNNNQVITFRAENKYAASQWIDTLLEMQHLLAINLQQEDTFDSNRPASSIESDDIDNHQRNHSYDAPTDEEDDDDDLTDDEVSLLNNEDRPTPPPPPSSEPPCMRCCSCLSGFKVDSDKKKF